MYTSIESVLDHYSKHNDLPVYKLYWGDKPTGQQLDESPMDFEHAQSLERLEQTLRNAGPGRYVVQFKPKLEANKGVITVHMNIPYTGANAALNPAAIGNPGMGMPAYNPNFISKEHMAQLLEAQREKMQTEFQLKMLEAQRKRDMEEFERKLKELKADKSSPINDFLSSDLGKIAGTILAQRFLGANNPPAVAGTQIVTDINHNELNTETPGTMDDNQKLMWAIDTLAPITGGNTQTVELLCRLAQWCADNQTSAIYTMLIGELNKVEPQFNTTQKTQ